ncbi:antibiotic biosynthesis monooxygenase [Roseateles sp. DAIF2]|uniref:antibiotic biosynthesis monooxygenase n=1 Tax=Roseateles sp. DAIF2 TaxID=2714952 RepID=UPI0018A2F9E7|nr:antibiotic biosynthesis monooxygenase [Roseateles sp. DAIF2]QPF75690.1 antibiotic biosynthesis monooxygenase [Roseateles sp. DAIF2]
MQDPQQQIERLLAAVAPRRPAVAASSSGPVFRADKYLVPVAMLEDFMAQIQRIDRTIAALPGCLRHLVLLQLDGRGRDDHSVEVMTLVEWADAAALQAAKRHLQQRHAGEGFSLAAFLQALGVRAEAGCYGQLA